MLNLIFLTTIATLALADQARVEELQKLWEQRTQYGDDLECLPGYKVVEVYDKSDERIRILSEENICYRLDRSTNV